MESPVLAIGPQVYAGRLLTGEEVLRYFFDPCEAVWVHDGNPASPHAELTSGMCSNGYFDCPRVLCYPQFTEILGRQLAQKLRQAGVSEVDWVVGSAYAAITFSYEVARAFGAVHVFTEKDPKDPKKQVWRRRQIPEGARVLQVEELMTTAQTMNEVHRAVEAGNETPVNFLPQVGVLVHRPPKLPASYGDRQIVALVEQEVWAADPPCQLCQAGSVRYRPKTHWAELTGRK